MSAAKMSSKIDRQMKKMSVLQSPTSDGHGTSEVGNVKYIYYK